MQLTDNTILITGGATGIGFALAEEFSRMGNIVIISRPEERISWKRQKRRYRAYLLRYVMFQKRKTGRINELGGKGIS